MAAILCLDFDDTIVLDNTTRQIFDRFATGDWRAAHEAYHRGEMSVEQFNAAALDMVDIDVSAEEMAEYVREVARPREGLLELYDWAHWNGWLMTVVSNGFDFYVDAVLDKLGLERVARHAGRTRREYRWRVRYLSPRGIEVQSDFKVSYAAAFRNAGDFVAYVGDGASDVEPARLARAVFARDTLWAKLKDEHPRIYPFETFHDIREVLEREAAGWLESFEAATAAD